jgi:hypothetical protein
VRRGLIANGHAREYYGEAKTSWCNWKTRLFYTR